MRISSFKLIVILLTLGIFFNSEIYPYSYLLFISYFEESRASCFNMDYDGNITLKQNFEVGWDAQYVTASPNGHMVIISADSYEPKLTYIYVNKEREINSIIHGSAKSPRPVVFSIDKPTLYIGSNPSHGYKINYKENSIDDLSTTYSIYTDIAGYSPYLKGIVWLNVFRGVGDIKLDQDGKFTTSTCNILINGGTTSDFTISPDGRWAAVMGIDKPCLSIVGIAQYGTLSLVEQWDFPFSETEDPEMGRYTPNGKYFIFLSRGPHFLLSFSVDQETGKLSKVDYIGPPVPIPSSWTYILAITPDNKYLVMVDIEPGGGYHSLDVVKIGEDGSLTWLTEKRLIIKGSPSDMDFVPFWRETLAPPHGWLAH